MPDFQRKTIPFLHRGMNWNSPVEKLADGQVCWAKNVRVLEQGTISSAHGHTPTFTIPASNYVHTMTRLNVFPGDPRPTDTPIFDVKLIRTHVVGADRALYVFQQQTDIDNLALNPVKTPLAGEQFNSFSGNPLSVVDAQPAGAAVAWKYIGDSLQMCSVGYYPGDFSGNSMARALTMGMTPPINTIGPYPDGAGQLGITPGGGDYQWMFAYRNTQTGARSNPSAASRVNQANPALRVVASQVSFYLPDVPNDPITGVPDRQHIKVDVYRFGGSIFRWALVGSGDGLSKFTDNMADLDLLAAPAPSQATDPISGLTRFNLFRPFVTQDVAHSGMALARNFFHNGIW